MKVWKDLLSGDEMVSDSYPHEITFDGACLEVRSKLKSKKENEDFGISNNDEEDGGAGGNDNEVSVIDVVDAH